uniref:Dachshund family transcription factor 2 n=1 Tax=Vombatus ursinus TaxID=29139 RepID=A0A4X2LP04_VOMUR
MAAAAQRQSPLSRAGASVIKETDGSSPASSPEESGGPEGLDASSCSPSQPEDMPQVIALMQTGEMQIAIPVMKPNLDKGQLAGQIVAPGFTTPFIFADSLSSVETLLTNIQFLLKVALDSARVQERQMQEEKKELRMELYREREMRETLERQLAVELQSRATVQRRLKKEKKAKRKLQEVLEFESKRREQMEQELSIKKIYIYVCTIIHYLETHVYFI